VPVNWQGARRLRLIAFAVGCAAALATVVVGCTVVVDGNGVADEEDVPVYRASVSSSVAASVSSSAARESKRQAALTTQALRTACEDLSSTSVDAVRAVNAYVDAANNVSGDVASTAGPAVDALNRSGALVSAATTDALPADLRDLLTQYVTATRAVADAITADRVDSFNAASTQLNTARDDALRRCDAAY
jgi:hypothetical protein